MYQMRWLLLVDAGISLVYSQYGRTIPRSGFVTHNQTETQIHVTLKVQHEEK